MLYSPIVCNLNYSNHPSAGVGPLSLPQQWFETICYQCLFLPISKTCHSCTTIIKMIVVAVWSTEKLPPTPPQLLLYSNLWSQWLNDVCVQTIACSVTRTLELELKLQSVANESHQNRAILGDASQVILRFPFRLITFSGESFNILEMWCKIFVQILSCGVHYYKKCFSFAWISIILRSASSIVYSGHRMDFACSFCLFWD